MSEDLKLNESLEQGVLPISSGVNYLKDGYIDYAKEVIAERAIVNLYDGMKPVNRRILWEFHQGNYGGRYVKSATISGNTMSYHPHSGDAIYKASVPMTDNSKFSQYPLIDGNGCFGDVSSGGRASAMRYTEMRLHSNADEMFGDLDGIEMIPNFDSTKQEPSVLPASFPYVLVNASEGIAVGFSSKIPSFNFNDVIDLTLEYLKDGYCHSIIAPDFTTGGYYINNNKELTKLMKVGKASIKLRGKAVVQGKEILFTEVPFGRTVAGLRADIDNKDIDGITTVSDLCDFEGAGLSIECRSKNKVDDVMYHLMKDTDLQYSYNANMVVIMDGVPRQLGVWSIIEEWVKWRRKVLTKATQARLEGCKARMREAQAFMNLIRAEEKKIEFVNIVAKEGKSAGKQYILDNFTREEIPNDLIDFVSSRSLGVYNTGGKYANEFAAAQMELKQYEEDLGDIDKAIIRDLERVKSLYGKNMPRHTEITYKDYDFTDKETETQVDNSSVVFAFKDNFLKKMRFADNSQEYQTQFEGHASDTLVGFDNRGRLIRVYTKDIPLCGALEHGTFLPKYLGLDEDDDYKIMWLGAVDGSTKMLIYSDGNVGFLDTSEFETTGRQVRVLQNGVHKTANLVGAVLEDIPEVLFVSSSDGKMGWVKTDNIKRKSRTAKTKVFNVGKDAYIDEYIALDYTGLITLLNNSSEYEAPAMHKLKRRGDYRGRGTESTSMTL